MRRDLWQSAFGEYGDLIDNDLVGLACKTYVADLANGLLLPRVENEYVPRLYQLDGARFIAERASSPDRPWGLLFDQPGMGKTLTTMWGLAAAGIERIIIVAPLTVKQQVWTGATIRRAFPSISDDRIATDLRSALSLPGDGPAVAVLHYEELRSHGLIHQLAAARSNRERSFEVLVLDEAHQVKERLSTGASMGPTRRRVDLAQRRSCVHRAHRNPGDQ